MQSIIFVVFFNIILYIALTVIAFFSCQPPKVLQQFQWSQSLFKSLPPEETIAVCFCSPAKSTALGLPLLYAMWAPVDFYTKAKTSVPVLLYTTEQICVAQFFVQLFRRWHARIIDNAEVHDLEELDARSLGHEMQSVRGTVECSRGSGV